MRCGARKNKRRQSPVLSANTERSSYQKGFKVPKEPTLVPRRCLEIPDRCDLLRRSRVWASSSLVQRKRLEIPDRCNLKSGVKYALSHPQLEAIFIRHSKVLSRGVEFLKPRSRIAQNEKRKKPQAGLLSFRDQILSQMGKNSETSHKEAKALSDTSTATSSLRNLRPTVPGLRHTKQ